MTKLPDAIDEIERLRADAARAALALPRDRSALDNLLAAGQAREATLHAVLTQIVEGEHDLGCCAPAAAAAVALTAAADHGALDTMLAEAREACAAIAENEPEPEGPGLDALIVDPSLRVSWDTRAAIENTVRAAVRATHANIARRIRETKGEP